MSTINIIMIAVLPYLIKISLLVLYNRLFGHNRKFRLTVYFCLALMVVLSISFFVPMAMQCLPLSSTWDLTPNGRRNCLNAPLLGFITTVVNAITDLLVMLLPLPVLWGLQLPLQKSWA